MTKVGITPEQLAGIGSQIPMDPRSYIGDGGDILPSSAVNDPLDPRFDPEDQDNVDRVVDIDELMQPPIDPEDDSTTGEELIVTEETRRSRSIGAPVVSELLNSDGIDGGSNVLLDSGEVVFIDNNQDFIAEPLVPQHTDRDTLLENMKISGWEALADKLVRLGIGLVTAKHLTEEGFRANVSNESFAAYLFELTGLNGDMRVAYYGALDEDGNPNRAFSDAYVMFLGKGAVGDMSVISAEADRIITEERAYMTNLGKRRTDRIRDVIHDRCKLHMGNTRVIMINGQPILYDDSVNEEF